MPDVPEVHSLNAAAASAAAEGNFPEAASLLQQVLDRQQDTLGPAHPDLATTLNNLALMLERSGEIDAAGRCYERAHTIAAVALPPDDPIVRVSDENLRAFREAHGRPVTTGAAGTAEGMTHEDLARDPEPVTSAGPTGVAKPPASSPARRSHAAPVQGLPLVRDTSTSPRPSRTSSGAGREARVAAAPADRPSSRLRPALIAAAGLVLVIAAGLWRAASDSPDRPADADGGSMQAADSPASQAPASAQPPQDAEAERPVAAPPVTTSEEPARAPATPDSPEPGRPPAPVPEAAPARTREAAAPVPSATDVEVVQASVCRSLSREGGVWSCQAIDDPARPGAVSYYTRVASPRAIEVRHRWSHDGQVLRVTRLQIAANPSAGFRTFTRQAVQPGEWQVTLLGPDDRVLHEQRFVVR